ncbi:MAG: hypothetical protein Q8N77_01855 [Nanoarchaeota archaeon]|nr:hypothetical protein [Nanoarchaeota archaeon]
MKIPESFLPENKERIESEIEQIVKKTLIDRVIVEDIAKELKKALEEEMLAERIEFRFNKTLRLLDNKNIPTKTHREQRYHNIIEYIEAYPSFFERLKTQEYDDILYAIKESDPSIKDEEIIHTGADYASVISKGAVYNLSLGTSTKTEQEKTDITIPVTATYTKRTAVIFKKTLEKTKDFPLVKVYENPHIYGEIKYAKFNQEHNQKLAKILQEMGYKIFINIKEPSKK